MDELMQAALAQIAAQQTPPAQPQTNAGYYFADPNQMSTLTGQNKGGSNAWLWKPTEENTKYQAYNFGGQNNYMTGEVAKYLKALGYGGNLASGGNISDQDAQAVNAFLQERGLSVQTGTHQVPGASQHTSIQRIIDSKGNPVAVDARNNRYDGNDRMTDIAKVGALAAAAYYAPQMFAGEGAGAGAAAGTGALGAGGMVMTPMGPAFIPAAAGGSAIGATGAAIGGGIASAIGGGGLLGSLGSALTNSGVGKAVGAVADVVGGGRNLAGIVGGIAGAMDGGKDQTSTTTQQIDPRMAQYLYGTGYGDKNSLLGAAQDWWKNNQSGMNANMQQGLDTLKNLYTSPGYTQGYTQMRDVGQGLLGRPIAGNPFTQGGLLGAPGQQMQAPAQPPRPEIGSPFGPTMEIGGGNFQALNPQPMPSPDIGVQQIKRPWSI